jgi:hypothetical protein
MSDLVELFLSAVDLVAIVAVVSTVVALVLGAILIAKGVGS